VTPADPLAYLFSLERLGMKFGLENISRLCAALDHPERAFASVIVGGTNGKGSVTVMTETALRAAGYRTARYTSPHLARVEERFVIDGAEVATTTLKRALDRVRRAVAALVGGGQLEAPPTFFEFATATAFDLFREAGVALAILEVGLGGRLDATNVVAPLAAAITSIDLDHQAQLGDTIESIAAEKAGIIKPGIPVVCGAVPPAAEVVIAGACDARGARLVRAVDAVRTTRHVSGDRATLDVRTARRTLEGVELALAGAHQAGNAAVAVALLDELDALGWRVSDEAVRAGLSGARWPARLERFTFAGAAVLLDAAHNPAGARALASYLEEAGWTDVTLVFGVMADKDVAGMLAPLVPLARRIICTTAPGARAMPAAAIAALVRTTSDAPVHLDAVDSPEAALRAAARAGTRVVVAGSIFLIGPLRDILR
jgi:dihydrofolate synthase/folylpolyglutamate synthase